MEIEKKAEGFEVIRAYTRAQALDDGVLVDLSDLAREVCFAALFVMDRGNRQDP